MVELPDYEYLEQLGEPGNFGTVFRAKNRLSGQLVAIKHIDGNAVGVTLGDWKAEAVAMAACEHENLAKIRHAEVTADGPVLVMEYLPDGSCESRWARRPVAVGCVINVVTDVCWGLHHLHTRQLTHRDIKPGNILLRGTQAVLGDFGLAAAPSVVPNMVYVAHTPAEVRAGAPWSAVADVYALGVTAYRLLCGDDDCGYTAPDIMQRVVAGKWPDRSRWPLHVHKKLQRVLRAAMHPDPTKRPQTAAMMRDRIEAARPQVSLHQVGALRWKGSADGQQWQVDITGSGSVWEVQTLRDLGKGLRRVPGARTVVPSLGDATGIAKEVLEALAATGTFLPPGP